MHVGSEGNQRHQQQPCQTRKQGRHGEGHHPHGRRVYAAHSGRRRVQGSSGQGLPQVGEPEEQMQDSEDGRDAPDDQKLLREHLRAEEVQGCAAHRRIRHGDVAPQPDEDALAGHGQPQGHHPHRQFMTCPADSTVPSRKIQTTRPTVSARRLGKLHQNHADVTLPDQG